MAGRFETDQPRAAEMGVPVEAVSQPPAGESGAALGRLDGGTRRRLSEILNARVDEVAEPMTLAAEMLARGEPTLTPENAPVGTASVESGGPVAAAPASEVSLPEAAVVEGMNLAGASAGGFDNVGARPVTVGFELPEQTITPVAAAVVPEVSQPTPVAAEVDMAARMAEFDQLFGTESAATEEPVSEPEIQTENYTENQPESQLVVESSNENTLINQDNQPEITVEPAADTENTAIDQEKMTDESAAEPVDNEVNEEKTLINQENQAGESVDQTLDVENNTIDQENSAVESTEMVFSENAEDEKNAVDKQNLEDSTNFVNAEPVASGEKVAEEEGTVDEPVELVETEAVADRVQLPDIRIPEPGEPTIPVPDLEEETLPSESAETVVLEEDDTEQEAHASIERLSSSGQAELRIYDEQTGELVSGTPEVPAVAEVEQSVAVEDRVENVLESELDEKAAESAPEFRLKTEIIPDSDEAMEEITFETDNFDGETSPENDFEIDLSAVEPVADELESTGDEQLAETVELVDEPPIAAVRQEVMELAEKTRDTLTLLRELDNLQVQIRDSERQLDKNLASGADET